MKKNWKKYTDFIVKETETVLKAFAEGRKSGGETTAGHWKRPVE